VDAFWRGGAGYIKVHRGGQNREAARGLLSERAEKRGTRGGLTEYKKVFNEIYVFSPSWGLDCIWNEVEKHAKGLETAEFKSTFHDHWDEDALAEIQKKQHDWVTCLKQQKSQEEVPRST
jgi:hypothetical protein